jgi:hypothetical protein
MLGTIIAKQRTKIPMQQPFSNSHFNNRRQAYVLLLLGVVFLTVAWLGMLNSYSLGVLFFGLGMLGAALFNPGRFLQVGWLPGSGLLVLGLVSLATSASTMA